MGAHAAKASRVAAASGQALVKNDVVKTIIASETAAPASEGKGARAFRNCMTITIVLVTAAASLHEKSEELVHSVSDLSGSVEHKEPLEKPWSTQNFKLFKEMQRVCRAPRLQLPCFRRRCMCNATLLE